MDLHLCEAYEAIQDMAQADHKDWVDDDDVMLDDALQGWAQLKVSHVGGKFSKLLDNILSGLSEEKSCYRDSHPRRDCEELYNNLFSKQIVDLGDAYMLWSSTRSKDRLDSAVMEEPEGVLREKYGLWIIDIYTFEALASLSKPLQNTLQSSSHSLPAISEAAAIHMPQLVSYNPE
ncbi:hypothetical protein ARMSODRAFT_970057 [Armillaria solidipes]|uniref:Uncharacterized protein n=1 Tax=Armillaria solidipes TaxID=1076256 RepID=A0A2H3C0K4_9AGAR|nr:hypothetical protein ARMSODRAFT_970057 [Armillaria solidipes]